MQINTVLSNFSKHDFSLFPEGGRANGLQTYIFTLILLVMLVALQGCAGGFKPRGAESITQMPLKGLAVLLSNTDQETEFVQVLKQELRSNGAELTEVAGPDVIVLNINGLKEDKTVSAYSAVRQVREFNHYIELDFAVSRQQPAGKPKQVEATVRAEKSQIYDSLYVLGGAEEERAIKDELRAEVVRLLALRLAVLR